MAFLLLRQTVLALKEAVLFYVQGKQGSTQHLVAIEKPSEVGKQEVLFKMASEGFSTTVEYHTRLHLPQLVSYGDGWHARGSAM